jgi:hypothetical protein
MNLTHATFLALLLSLPAHAQDERFTGEARKDGRILYIEQHTVSFDKEQRIRSAETQYVSESGVALARIRSDFGPSETAPDYEFEDFVSGHTHGVRREGKSLILFDRPKGQPEKIRTMSAEETKDLLVVGCQGLNYYLLPRLAEFSSKRELRVRLLAPGKLDFYDFTLKSLGALPEATSTLSFKLEASSWFLRLFAPSLDLRYEDGARPRLVYYRGLSNLPDAQGNPQSVEIRYTYPKLAAGN